MHDLELQPGFAGVPRDLEEAARIPRGQDTRPALPDAGDLHPPQLLGHSRLGQIVDARAPAAELGVLDVYEREAGNAAEKGARLGAYLLAMDEMAGVVIRDGEAKLSQREIRVHEDFRNVSYLVREPSRSPQHWSRSGRDRPESSPPARLRDGGTRRAGPRAGGALRSTPDYAASPRPTPRRRGAEPSGRSRRRRRGAAHS